MPHNKNRKNKKNDNPGGFWESPYSVKTFLREIDIFGQKIPTFNIKGKDRVQTAIGGILTALIISVTIGYAISKLHDLIIRADPNIR